MPTKQYHPLGVNTDIPPETLPDDLYNVAVNVRFINDETSRIDGVKRIFDGALFPPKYMIQTGLGANFLNIYPSDTAIGVVVVNTHSDITPVAGITQSPNDNEWTGGKLNGIPIMNNGAGDPLFWDENVLNPAESLPGWPVGYKCRALRSFKYHLFALGITDELGNIFNDLYMWSDAADPGAIPQSWTATPTTEAGDDQLSETKGDIQDAVVLRDSLLIYKDTSVYTVTYVAGNNVFSNRLLFSQVGLLSRNCCVEVFGEHYCFTTGDLIKHDGHTVTSLADSQVRDEVFLQLDPENYQTSFVTWDPLTKTVWFCFPRVGNRFPDTAVTYNIQTGLWSTRELYQTTPYAVPLIIDEPDSTDYDDWGVSNPVAYDDQANQYNQAQFSEAIERLMQLDYVNTRMYAVDVGNLNDTEDVTGFVRKESMDLDDPNTIKTTQRIWLRLAGQGSVNVRLGSQETPGEAIAWGDLRPYAPEQEKMDYFVSGRYISLEVIGVDQQHWSIVDFRIEYQTRGKF